MGTSVSCDTLGSCRSLRLCALKVLGHMTQCYSSLQPSSRVNANPFWLTFPLLSECASSHYRKRWTRLPCNIFPSSKQKEGPTFLLATAQPQMHCLRLGTRPVAEPIRSPNGTIHQDYHLSDFFDNISAPRFMAHLTFGPILNLQFLWSIFCYSSTPSALEL